MADNKTTNTVATDSSASSATKAAPQKTPFSVIEAYKGARIQLINALAEAGGNVAVFSSPNASEGKSTTVSNIAITLSQLKKRVLLIDADSRRPTIHTKFKFENDLGLLDILSDNANFETVVHHYSPFLDVVTSGSNYSNPSELYSSKSYDNFIDTVSREYDYVLIDTPPVNIVSDALVIGQKATGIVLVVRAGVTDRQSLVKATNLFRSLIIMPLGIVVNATDSRNKKYVYKKYGYHKYGY